jgi:hypothetical protein
MQRFNNKEEGGAAWVRKGVRWLGISPIDEHAFSTDFVFAHDCDRNRFAGVHQRGKKKKPLDARSSGFSIGAQERTRTSTELPAST